jgi:hypothetical protein
MLCQENNRDAVRNPDCYRLWAIDCRLRKVQHIAHACSFPAYERPYHHAYSDDITLVKTVAYLSRLITTATSVC